MTEQPPEVLRAKGIEVERTVDGVMATFTHPDDPGRNIVLLCDVGDAAMLGAALMRVASSPAPDPRELLDSDDGDAPGG